MSFTYKQVYMSFIGIRTLWLKVQLGSCNAYIVYRYHTLWLKVQVGSCNVLLSLLLSLVLLLLQIVCVCVCARSCVCG